MLVWWMECVVFGSVLGVVGASIRRPGVVGLLAALTVPVGAAVEMLLLPREGGAFGVVNPVYDWLRPVVWAAAAATTAVLVVRSSPAAAAESAPPILHYLPAQPETNLAADFAGSGSRYGALTSPTHDHRGMVKPSGTSSADR